MPPSKHWAKKQKVPIKIYKTKLKKFLLYPTINYTLKDNYKQNFQNKYQSFVQKNTLNKKEDDNIDIKY